MNMVENVVNEKYYGKTDTEKVDLGRLYYLFIQSLFFFTFVYLSFYLK